MVWQRPHATSAEPEECSSDPKDRDRIVRKPDGGRRPKTIWEISVQRPGEYRTGADRSGRL
jgi:hypothetical protein